MSMVKSEEVLGELFDRCAADTALKTFGAGAIGVITAALVRRQFPLWLGIGFGLGMGIANCRHDMMVPFSRRRENNSDDLTFVEEPARKEALSHAKSNENVANTNPDVA